MITHERPVSFVEFLDVAGPLTGDRGGRFAAMEAPGLLVADVRDFFRALR